MSRYYGGIAITMERANKLKKSEESGDMTLGGMYVKYALTVLKASVLAVIVTVVLLLIAAVVLLLTGIDDSASPYIVQAVRIVAVCLAGFICGKTVPKMGWLAGTAAGLGYVLITVVLGLIFFGTIGVDGALLCDVIIAAVAGLASGIVGINTSKKKKS